MAAASSISSGDVHGVLVVMVLFLCLTFVQLESTELNEHSKLKTPTIPYAVDNETLSTNHRENQTMPTLTETMTTLTMTTMTPNVTRTTQSISTSTTTASDNPLCRRCLIAMAVLAIVAAIFMVTTIVLCSKVLNMPKEPSHQQRSTKMSARSSPTGSSTQGFWIEPAATMKERSEFWYRGSTKKQENGLSNHTSGFTDDVDSWTQPPVPKARAAHGARQSSISRAGTDRHLLAPPVITLHNINDFWQREGRSDNSSFKAVPSSHGTISEAGADSNSTEEHGSEFFQVSASVGGRQELGDTGGDDGCDVEEELEAFPVVQPKVTPEQISAFWNRGRVADSRFRNGEVTLL
ncbi:transmembrane protein C16orf54 homolog [Pleurodeles waltl]